jgi:putative ABC transport system substrate-binding protein
MRRRDFITLLGGTFATWPFAARAQQPAKLPTIGFFGPSTPSAMSQWVPAFVQRLHELGWIEGRTVAIEYRWAEGRSERFAEIAAEFVRLKVDVIVTGGRAVPAAKQIESPTPAASPKKARTRSSHVQRRVRNTYSPSPSYSHHNYYQSGYARVVS